MDARRPLSSLCRLWVVWQNESTRFFRIFYRRPKTNAADARALFDDISDVLYQYPDAAYVIKEDFNIDICPSKSSPYATLVSDLCNKHHLADRTHGSTRVATTHEETTFTKTDLMLCSLPSRWSVLPGKDVSYADHHLCRTQAIHKSTFPIHKTITVWLWRHSMEDQLFFGINQFNQRINQFNQRINQSINRSIVDKYVSVLTGTYVTGLCGVIDSLFPDRYPV